MSASLMLLLELEYMNKLHCVGWNSAAVMTSVNSSILAGLMSTISKYDVSTFAMSHNDHYVLKDWSLIFRFQRLTRRSSAEMYVS